MPNPKNYRTPSDGDDPNVPVWMDRLANDVATDVARIEEVIPEVVTHLGDEYQHVTTDAAGHFLMGVRTDGGVEVGRLHNGGAVTYDANMPGWQSATTDAAGHLLWGVRTDGTVVIGRLAGAVTAGPPPVTLGKPHIIVPFGQSNAQDRSAWLNPANVDYLDPRIKQWDIATGKAVPLEPDHTYLGLYFAQAYLREHPSCPEVILVPAAVGSTGFKEDPNGSWNRNTTTSPNLVARMLAAVKAARTATGGEIVAMLWSQGEHDARSETKASYSTKFDDLATYCRSQLGLPNLPIVLGSMSPIMLEDFVPPFPPDVQNALQDTPRRLYHTSYVYGPDDMFKETDVIHYSVGGQRVRGGLFVEGLRRARTNTPGNETHSPRNVSVTRSGNQAYISWEHYQGPVIRHELRISTDYGATWTDIVLPEPLAQTHTVTVPAGTPVWARVRTVGNTVANPDWLPIISHYSLPAKG